MAKKHKWYVFDFETRGENFYNAYGYTEIYLWDACELGTYKHTHGLTADSFIDFLIKNKANGYFHNLAFDFEFILYMLDKRGFTSVSDIEKLKPNTYYINRQGMQLYRVSICFNENIKVSKNGKVRKEKYITTLYDSLKLLPFKVKEIGKAYELGLEKQFDSEYYDIEKGKEYEVTDVDIKGCELDTEIVARALDKIQENGVHKMTLASNAFGTLKCMLAEKGIDFKKLCPPLSYEVDSFLRNGYFGGFCYYKKEFQNKELKNVIVYDVNSLYPFSYTNTLLPVGRPMYFIGEFHSTDTYKLYVQRFRANFKLKPNHVPTIQKNKTSISTKVPEYLEDSNDLMLELTLTNIDLELFKLNYDIIDIEYIDGYMFMGRDDLFTEFTERFIKEKKEAGAEGNAVKRQTAKNNLNMCYGKPATNLIAEKYMTNKDSEGVIRQVKVGEELTEGIYLPLSMFITAYARDYVIRAILDNIENFIYCDTDSMHLTQPAKNIKIDIDNTGNLGEWKIEHKCTRYKFIQPKRYIYEEKHKKVIKCAGMTETAQQEFIEHNSFEEMLEKFKNGYEFMNLKKRNVKGGCILLNVKTELKER